MITTLTCLKTTQELLCSPMFLSNNNSTEHCKATAVYPQLSSLLKDVSVHPLDKISVYASLRQLADQSTEKLLVQTSEPDNYMY